MKKSVFLVYGSLVFLFCSLLSIDTYSQEKDKVDEDVRIFSIVEEEASYPGGYDALMEFLAKNIQYPEKAKKMGVKGKVFVTFIVEKDGSISDIKVLRDIGYGCGEEVIRVIKLMPKWKPAKQRGKAVRQQFNLPVSFNLDKEDKQEKK